MNKLLVLLLPFFFSFSVFSQNNDASLWTSVSIEKKINPKLSAEFSQEFRFSDNFSELGEFFSDAGVSYRFNKNIRTSVNYRYSNKRKNDNIFNKRHRYYADITFKEKFKPVIIQYRSRGEIEYRQLRKTEDNIGPLFSWKHKFTVKADLDEKYEPYIYYELSTTLESPYGYYIDEMKYCGGIEYRFNRMNAIDVFYLLKKEYGSEDPETTYIIGVGYYYTF